MNTTFERQVPGMSCQGCVKRMREAIQTEDPTAEVVGEPDEQRLSVTTRLDEAQLDRTLQKAGYPPADRPLHQARQVPGMSCQSCVGKMRQAIQAEDPNAEVAGEPAEKRLDVVTRLDDQTLDQLLAEAGYPTGAAAAASDEKAPAERDEAPADEAAAKSETADSERATTRRLAISGMTCASCVKSVQQALEKTPGVATASVN
ncbi:MAG TPA: cation transporter, partial [Halomonas sp.]|nr:cation transporter [Halomonas sp.]